MRLGAFLQYKKYTVTRHQRVGRSTCHVHLRKHASGSACALPHPVPCPPSRPHTHTHTHTHNTSAPARTYTMILSSCHPAHSGAGVLDSASTRPGFEDENGRKPRFDLSCDQRHMVHLR